MSAPMYSVSSLVHYIKESFDHDFALQSIMIKGEVSNFTNHHSGHWYFTLKDAKAKISCVMFANYASRSKILLKEGMSVIVTASVSMYEAAGSVQLYVSKVQVDGLGDLYLQLEEVKKKMEKEGLFDPSHKKALPLYPMSIGVITAKTGAAIQDILTTIARRWPLADVVVYPSLVQGSGASEALITQLKKADQENHDVILLARGGGAIEDLWCFNEEKLARQVYAMNTVIVSGVGHESDTTLVDYVSDARAATPTAAAEMITPDRIELATNLTIQKSQLNQLMKSHLQQANKQLSLVKSNRYLKDPMSYIAQLRLRLAMHIKELSIVESLVSKKQHALNQASYQLARHCVRIQTTAKQDVKEKEKSFEYTMKQLQQTNRQQLVEKVKLLDAYSPLKVLSRGYNIAYSKDKIIKSVKEVKEQEELILQMQDGLLTTQVKKKELK